VTARVCARPLEDASDKRSSEHEPFLKKRYLLITRHQLISFMSRFFLLILAAGFIVLVSALAVFAFSI
jgi:hypothetical protein